jgi:hypothetical protein
MRLVLVRIMNMVRALMYMMCLSIVMVMGGSSSVMVVA